LIYRLLDYVEIKTKITSLFAFLMSMAYLFYRDQPINWKPTIVFFCSMFLFDLSTTAINNYIDSKTNGQKLQFERHTAKCVIYVMLATSISLGLYLTYITDLVILLAGGLCFLCGVLYTYGPVPISRQPLGEVLSGIFYGFFIPFLVLYVNMPKGTFLSYSISLKTVFLQLEIVPLITVGLLAVAPFCTTANIMLANNICDLKKDIAVKRHTLPYYLGENSLPLFSALYYMTYIATLLMTILKILSPLCLASILNIYWIRKNIKEFRYKQEKESTFIISIKNYIIIMGTNTMLIFISGLIK